MTQACKQVRFDFGHLLQVTTVLPQLDIILLDTVLYQEIIFYQFAAVQRQGLTEYANELFQRFFVANGKMLPQLLLLYHTCVAYLRTFEPSITNQGSLNNKILSFNTNSTRMIYHLFLSKTYRMDSATTGFNQILYSLPLTGG